MDRSTQPQGGEDCLEKGIPIRHDVSNDDEACDFGSAHGDILGGPCPRCKPAWQKLVRKRRGRELSILERFGLFGPPFLRNLAVQDKMVRGIISFSLWGDQPRYLAGALRNAELAPHWYPGWRCRYYCGQSVPAATRDALAAYPHVEVIERSEVGDWTGLFWRFLAATDPSADAVIFRDTDSRLGRRERAAVENWLASGRPAHLMRDHPEHNVPILGGMWGIRRGALDDFDVLMADYEMGDYWQADQEFLAAKIATRLCGGWLQHDEYFGGEPFPEPRRGSGFVGQPFDEYDRPLIEGPNAAARLKHRTVGRVQRALRLRSALLRCPS